MIGGDDMYVVVDNLREYLGTDERVQRLQAAGEPQFIGRRWAVLYSLVGAGGRARTAVAVPCPTASWCWCVAGGC
jgi:hypothetical protein